MICIILYAMATSLLVNYYVIYEQPLPKMKAYAYTSNIVAVCMQRGRSSATVNTYIYCVAQMQHLLLFCRSSATLGTFLSNKCNTSQKYVVDHVQHL